MLFPGIRYLTFCLALCLPILGQAQRGWEAGAGLGVSNYFGDLNTSFDFSHPGGCGYVLGRFNFDQRICARMGLGYGHITGNDKWSNNTFERTRNLNFSTNILEAQMGIEFNFLKYAHNTRDYEFTPYALAGFTVFQFNPYTTYQGKEVFLQELGTEGQFYGEEYHTTTIALLFGGGIKYNVSSRTSLNLELGLRYSTSDYLDDVAGEYASSSDLLALHGPIAVALADRSVELGVPPIGETGRQRGNARNSDYYTFLTLGFFVYFGDIRCPKIYNY